MRRSATSRASRPTPNTRTRSRCCRSRGASRTAAGWNSAPAGVRGATFQGLTIVHNIDKATPKLLEACATGTHLKDATITHRKAGKGQQEYLIVKMNDVIITAVAHGGTTAQPASETVTLAFAKVDFEYKPQKPDGSLDAGIHFKYDLKANKVG
ncbi:MAG TPA: type VI secretion system tube protein Hcp [Vicinamibacterales bacterium]|nr:type VI secretion system tube protein Hcp [Vicinamibacterales bacterium]